MWITGKVVKDIHEEIVLDSMTQWYRAEAQRFNLAMLNTSRTPFVQNTIRASVLFAEKLFKWIKQLPCEFQKRFAIFQKTDFSECS
jgi:hypothetical protein